MCCFQIVYSYVGRMIRAVGNGGQVWSFQFHLDRLLLPEIEDNVKLAVCSSYVFKKSNSNSKLEFYRTHTLCALSTVSTDCTVTIL